MFGLGDIPPQGGQPTFISITRSKTYTGGVLRALVHQSTPHFDPLLYTNLHALISTPFYERIHEGSNP